METGHSARPLSDASATAPQIDRTMRQQSSVMGPHVQSFNRLALAGTVPAIYPKVRTGVLLALSSEIFTRAISKQQRCNFFCPKL